MLSLTVAELRQLILSGDSASALQLVNELYPGILEIYRKPRFLLCCQHFIELIRHEKIGDAIEHAQKVLSQFKGLDQQEESLLEEVLGLLAYGDIANSPGISLCECRRD